MSTQKIFDALASLPRRQILAFLSKDELSAGDIAARFDMSAPAVSRHLGVLVNAGLVSSERRGQFVVYKLIPDNLVNTLTQFAFEICPVAGPIKRAGRKTARTRSAK